MHSVLQLQIARDYNLLLTFENGVTKILDVKPFIRDGVSKPLNDPAFFRLVSTEPGGGITWPNGFDFCPNYLWEISK